MAPPERSIESSRLDEHAEEVVDGRRGSRHSGRTRELILFTWALLATATVIVLAVWVQHNQQTSDRPSHPAKRSLVFMVSDGMGPASLSLARSFRQLVDNLPIDDTLTLDRHFWGTSRTRSSNSLVTDSAAGATAFSCGEKSYNGAIATLPDFTPCGTVLEAAKRAGYATGLVVTTDITDATPACFASHVNYRIQNDEIALQEIGQGPLGRVVDLMLGGGRCHFLPNSSSGSCRQDDVDVVRLARRAGWTYVDDRPGFNALGGGRNLTLPTLALLAGGDFPFEIDRRKMDELYPSLSEMTATALEAMEFATRNSDKGFFLMIEGSRIVHAGHQNDPATQVREVLEYDKAFRAVVDFIGRSESEIVLVATSDHETGGLSTAWRECISSSQHRASPLADPHSVEEPGHLPVYDWYPSVLAKANASAEHLARLLQEHISSLPARTPASAASLRDWINLRLVIDQLGITDAPDEDLDLLVSNPELAATTFAGMVSSRAHVGWATQGHSAVDVHIYSSGGPGTEKLRGNVENTDSMPSPSPVSFLTPGLRR